LGNPLAMWRRVGTLRGLLAMRLHAAVFGFGNVTPTVLLSYEEKCDAWADMCGHPGSMISTVDELTPDHLALLLGSDAPLPDMSLAEAQRLAAGNFEALASD